jgi:hypothetical protein
VVAFFDEAFLSPPAFLAPATGFLGLGCHATAFLVGDFLGALVPAFRLGDAVGAVAKKEKQLGLWRSAQLEQKQQLQQLQRTSWPSSWCWPVCRRQP